MLRNKPVKMIMGKVMNNFNELPSDNDCGFVLHLQNRPESGASSRKSSCSNF